MNPQMYRQQIYDTGIEDMELDVSSLQRSMRTLDKLDDLEEMLKEIAYNLRVDMRRLRLDYIKRMQGIDELSNKTGLFGRKMSVEKILEKKRSLKRERKINLGAYEIIEIMVDNYLTQIEDSRHHIRNHIQDKVH